MLGQGRTLIAGTGESKRIRMAVFLVVVVFIAVLPTPADAEERRRVVASLEGHGLLAQVMPGDEGNHVVVLQEKLAEAGFLNGHIDGVFGRSTSSAVVAFHKLIGTNRDAVFRPLDWLALHTVLEWPLDQYGIPRRVDEPNRLELDLTRQLMFLVRDGDLAAILPISSGGTYTYWSERNQRFVASHTPRGDFTLFRHDVGWRCEEITGWCVQNYWAFHPFYGIHGYLSVPSYPASHGCARVNTWDSEWLETQLSLGMPIHIWDEMPEVAPPPGPPPSTTL